MVASIFTLTSPAWTFLLRLSASLLFIARIAGCYCCYTQPRHHEPEIIMQRHISDPTGDGHRTASAHPQLMKAKSADSPVAIAVSPDAAAAPEHARGGDAPGDDELRRLEYGKSGVVSTRVVRPGADMVQLTEQRTRARSAGDAVDQPADKPAPTEAVGGSGGAARRVTVSVDTDMANLADAVDEPHDRRHNGLRSPRDRPVYAQHLCALHACFTFPALFFEAIGRPLAKRCSKVIVTVMGYYNQGYLKSYTWTRNRMDMQVEAAEMHFDELLSKLLSMCAVIAGVLAVYFASSIETKSALFAFVVAYSTTKLCLEPFTAGILSAWISSLTGEARNTEFDKLLKLSNNAIRSMIALKKRS